MQHWMNAGNWAWMSVMMALWIVPLLAVVYFFVRRAGYRPAKKRF